MSVQPMGGWWDTLSSAVSSKWNDWFGSTPDYTAYYGGPGGGAGAGFGYSDNPFRPGDYTGITEIKFETTNDRGWKEYKAGGGLMAPTTSELDAVAERGWEKNQKSDTFTGISSGLNDFLSGVNSTLGSLGGIFGQGLQAYAAVQQLINDQNPSDQIIRHPALGVVVQRTQGGNTTYVPVATAYPQFAGQIQQAEKSSNMNSILLIGALALGAFILLKDKKK
jgi:hypothetical protein